MAFLAEVGAERDKKQQTKTRWALEYYVAKLARAPGAKGRGKESPQDAAAQESQAVAEQAMIRRASLMCSTRDPAAHKPAVPHIVRRIAGALAACIALIASGTAAPSRIRRSRYACSCRSPQAARPTSCRASRRRSSPRCSASRSSSRTSPARAARSRWPIARAAPRRLHDRVRVAGHARVQPGDLRQARLRLDEGLPAGLVHRRRVERDDRPAGERGDEPPTSSPPRRRSPASSTFSSGGAGTSHHLSGVLFARVTGTNLMHVPYKGAPQGVLAVMAGEVTMGFFNTPTVIGQIKEGKVKALGVTSLEALAAAARTCRRSTSRA